jgi:thymidylate synthase
MRQYLDLVADTLSTGSHKPNRTGVDTISDFSHHYTVDLAAGFPLLTTKDLSGFRWHSLIHELLWYLSGEEHIRNLCEETGIWNAWADEDGNLDTAYGRFWRRYPVPDESDRLPGESWTGNGDLHRFQNDDGTFDQLAYALEQLRENPHSRRIVVNAWHPANAAVSTLPPCHYTFVFNVQDGRLNTHLTQRSGDIALGVPFNVAAYSLLTHAVANRTDLDVGRFGHTVVDAHIYCGRGARGDWYAEHLGRLQSHLADADAPEEYEAIREWLTDAAPPEADGDERLDHVPGLLTQLTREPRERPTIEVANEPLDELSFDDFELSGYDPAPGIDFAVAE